MWGGFTAEQLAEWAQAHQGNAESNIITKVEYKCDSCQRYFSKFNSYVEFGGKFCHMFDTCLEKFRKKYWESMGFCTKPTEQQEGI